MNESLLLAVSPGLAIMKRSIKGGFERAMMLTVKDRSVFNGQHLLYGIADCNYVTIVTITSYMYS